MSQEVIVNLPQIRLCWKTRNLQCCICGDYNAHLDIISTDDQITGWHIQCWVSCYKGMDWYNQVAETLKNWLQQHPDLALEE